jgi:hypothetical protein
VKVLSRLFRRLLLEKLAAAHKAGQLQFFGQHAHLANRKAFAAYLAPLRKRKWYVYSKPPFGGPKAVLAYLARYTHRVAISNVCGLRAIGTEPAPASLVSFAAGWRGPEGGDVAFTANVTRTASKRIFN